MVVAVGSITPIIMLHYVRIHLASRIALSHFAAVFQEASYYVVNCLWREPCDKDLRWPLEVEDSLWLIVSKKVLNLLVLQLQRNEFCQQAQSLEAEFADGNTTQ